MRFTLILAALAFHISSNPAALATSFYERPFSESVQDAPVIVRGKVGMTYGDWGKSSDGTKRLYTYYELAIDEVFKGAASGHSLQMRELGGEKDGIGMQVAGSAKFNKNEDVVVFLGDKNRDGSYDLRGMMMGKFDVQTDENGHEVLVGPGLDKLGNAGRIVHDDEAGQADTHGNSTWTLEALRKIVADQAERKRQVSRSGVPSGLPAVKSGSIDDAKQQMIKPDTQAPQLQSSQEQGEKPAGGFLESLTVRLILAGLVVLALVAWRRLFRH